jgi:hypothetical protein
MEKNEVIEITQKEALEVVKKQSSKIHCFMGTIGADWNKKSVIDLIKNSERFAWAWDMFEHNLAVINDGKLYHFDIKRCEAKN